MEQGLSPERHSPAQQPTAPDELLATCWTSAGDAASDRPDLRSPLPLRERIEAASAAGFRGFGLLSDDLPAAVAEYGLTGIRAMLADNGMVHLELEGIPYLVGRRAAARGIRPCPARRPGGGGGARRPAHQGHPRRRRRLLRPRPLGREVRRAGHPGRTVSAPGWGSSSSRGRTSRRCPTAFDSSATPDTMPAVSSSTPGTSPARTRRLPTWRRCHRSASSASS